MGMPRPEMARGNRRGPIVMDDADRVRFVATLAEACEKAASID